MEPRTAQEAFAMVEEHGHFAVSGDWHGQTGWGRYMVQLIADATLSPAILHLGDFGFWPGGRGEKFLHRINKELKENNKWLFITLGNHEDYIQVSRLQPVPGMDGCLHNREYPHIVVLPRGYRWTWGGKKFISVGGANSIDREWRTKNIDWWEGERITLADVYASNTGGPVDVMLSHDAPAGIPIFGTHRDASMGWSVEALSYAHESREKLRLITDCIMPRLLFHGHYHKPLEFTTELSVLGTEESYTIHSRCLDKDYSGNNIGVFHIGSEAFEGISIPKPDWKFPYDLEDAWWIGDRKRHVWW